MLGIKHDAVLVIIYIRRILEAPLAVINSHRNNAVILSGRVVDTTGIALIFTAEQTFGIT